MSEETKTPFELLPAQAQEVMRNLHTTEWMSKSALIDKMGNSETWLTQWLDKLLQAGWIEQEQRPDASPTGGVGYVYRVKSSSIS